LTAGTTVSQKEQGANFYHMTLLLQQGANFYHMTLLLSSNICYSIN